MRYIIAATAFALIAGIALGLVVSKGLDGSASAAPPTQAVEEQNLDGSGFIRVHEQGVADVNVLSVPSLAGRLIELGTVAASRDSTVRYSLTDVSDCDAMRVMARTTHASGLAIDVFYNESPDGSALIRGGAVTERVDGTEGGVSTASALISGPHRFIQVIVENFGTAGDVTAWIWCAP